MLFITVPSVEMFDEKTNRFYKTKSQDLRLEHSLVSISKWEAKWQKPFLSKDDKTIEETLDYIRCMTLTQNVPPDVYTRLTESNIEEISKYINASMTATTFSNKNMKPNREIITSEVLYYWMIAFNIPFECQKWHLNRLVTLINICKIKNQPEKSMSKRDIMARNKALNAQRKAQLQTKG